MGTTSSKAARKLPKQVPSWNIPRPGAPPFNENVRNQRPLAGDENTKDPHFLANLTRLGPVNVNQPPQVVRTNNIEKSPQLLESRIREDQDASSSIRNRVSASTLSLLLDQRKSTNTPEDVEALVKKYEIDWAKFGVVSRYVNSPSIQLGSALRTVGKDGEENVTVLAVWVEPLHE